MVLFLDSCIVIYWVEMAEPYYSQWLQRLGRLQKRYPKAQLAVSRLSVLECFVAPLKEQNLDIYKVYYDFFSNPGVNVVELDADVMDQATQLRAYCGLKTPDALQAACALSLGEDVKFVTNDKVFHNVLNLSVIDLALPF